MRGAKPVRLDPNDLSYHGSFRKYGAIPKPLLPQKFTVDIGQSNFNQNLNEQPYHPALFEGCTGFTQTDNLADQIGSIALPEFTYKETCQFEGHDTTSGCEIRNSLKMTQAYGVHIYGESSNNSFQHRGGKYFNIYDDGQLDWFDSIATAIFERRVGASIGTPWFPSWMRIGSDGELPMPSDAELDQMTKYPYSIPWHNYAAKGFEGDALQIKPWLGHFVYMPRAVADRVLEIRGAAAFIQPRYAPQDLFTIKLTTWQVALTLMLRQLSFARLN